MKWADIPSLFPSDHPKWREVAGLSRTDCEALHAGRRLLDEEGRRITEVWSCAGRARISVPELDRVAAHVGDRGNVIGRWMKREDDLNIAEVWVWRPLKDGWPYDG